jgi:hypothetical protein
LGNGIIRRYIPSGVYDFGPELGNSALSVPVQVDDGLLDTEVVDDATASSAEARQSTLVATIRDLMAQANLPFSADQAQTIDELVQLRSERTRLQSQLADNQSEVELLRKRLEDFDVETTCSVCYQGALDSDVVVDTVCLPCGHMYCNTCAHRLNDCAVCKVRIASRHRTFK